MSSRPTAIPPAKARVLLALSGGVDSAVATKLLLDAGHTVEGLVIRFSPEHDKAVSAAQSAAEELDIPLNVAHCEELFDTQVVQPFCEAYSAGRTPNPCVMCNPLVKFHTLAAKADELDIETIATGHYARVVQQNNRCYAASAASTQRDQSYMLYRLPQPILSRLLLPLGEYEKPHIRSIARKMGLSSAEAPDSQDICFIPNGDYAAYIEARGYHPRQGYFLAPDGTRLNRHNGVLHYTVGQRKGLGIALGHPVFVKSIKPSGDIQLAWAENTTVPAILLSDAVWSDPKLCNNQTQCFVKIRSVAKPVPCTVTPVQNALHLAFATPQRSPAPGQHAVLYHDGLVIGGGVIEPEQTMRP